MPTTTPTTTSTTTTTDVGPGFEADAGPAADPRPDAVVDLTVTPATAADPVCGMTVAAVATSPHADHQGHRYWFCGGGCAAAFRSDPAAYVA
jgi:xanthine dehydrogenase accessory factor